MNLHGCYSNINSFFTLAQNVLCYVKHRSVIGYIQSKVLFERVTQSAVHITVLKESAEHAKIQAYLIFIALCHWSAGTPPHFFLGYTRARTLIRNWLITFVTTTANATLMNDQTFTSRRGSRKLLLFYYFIFIYLLFTYVPGTDGGTRLRRAVTVASATCSGLYLVAQDWPAVTMFGLRRVPSRKMWWSASAL